MRTVQPTLGRSTGNVSPYVSPPPPVGSPTITAFVARSISAEKFPAAEKVARPTRRYSLPRLFTVGEPKSVVSEPYVVLSPPPFNRMSTITRRTFGLFTSRSSLRRIAGVGERTEL